ncbi:MAG: hypothetical protein EYC69_11425 [Bacteroidetes bacterium]|nr:MAG: hypothetical protein EYC69_11425 [Bacteroidota bacterium]
MFSPEEKERYSRQILLDSFGEDGQVKLKQAAVLVVGAGGLACPAMTYLVAAGIGHIGIMDDDTVERSNLQRQTLYSTNDIGRKKVNAAAGRLRALNPNVRVSEYDFVLSTENALDLIAQFDIVIDGTDNLAARYLINDACALLKKPWVYGSVYKFEGQVALFNFPLSDNLRSADYRSLFPEPPPASSLATCNEVGVVGVVPGLIGLLQATECIKYLTNETPAINSKLICFDALNLSFESFELLSNSSDKGSRPLTATEFHQKDYMEYCQSKTDGSCEINTEQFESIIKDRDFEIIDIREAHEFSTFSVFKTRHLPYSSINIEQFRSNGHNKIVFICRRGIRSKLLIEKLKSENVNGVFFSLIDGAEGWNRLRDSNFFEKGHVKFSEGVDFLPENLSTTKRQ